MYMYMYMYLIEEADVKPCLNLRFDEVTGRDLAPRAHGGFGDSE